MNDDEGVQNKAYNYMWEVMRLRGYNEPELCHPKFNSWKRASKWSGLETAQMKITICCNYNHGSFTCGDKLLSKKEHFGDYLQKQNAEYFSDIAEKISYDRCEPVNEDNCQNLMEEFFGHRAIQTRTLFVTCLQAAHTRDVSHCIIMNISLKTCLF